MTIRKEIVSSLALMLAGVVFLLYDLKYPLDQWANPGPGVFPLMVGGVWVILTAWQLVQSFRGSGSLSTEEKSHEDIKRVRTFLQRNKGETRALYLIAVFIAYLLMVRWVGFFISNFLFVITSSRLLGAKDWGGPVFLSVGINLFCYFLFEIWLKLSFPRGFLL